MQSRRMTQLEKMEEEGVETDVAVYNVLIGGLRKVGRVDEGWRVLEGMVGRGVCPNEGTYNEVLCGLVELKANKEDKSSEEEEEAIPQFRITEVHVAGLKTEPHKKKVWGT